MNFKSYLLAVTVAMIVAGPAFAQSTQTSNAGSESVGAASITQNSFGDPGVNYSGGYTLKNTPDLGSLYATPTAPCIVTGGFGITAPGFGIEGQAGVRDQVCTYESEIAVTYHMGQPYVAMMIFCKKSEDYRDGRALAGAPCPVASYPKSQQADVRTQQIAAGFLAPDGMTLMANRPAPAPSQPSPLSKSCASLNPNQIEDRPYIIQCLKTH